MVEPLRHRQTKGAENRHARPTATAPHPDSTHCGNSTSTLPFLKLGCGSSAPCLSARAGRAWRRQRCLDALTKTGRSPGTSEMRERITSAPSPGCARYAAPSRWRWGLSSAERSTPRGPQRRRRASRPRAPATRRNLPCDPPTGSLHPEGGTQPSATISRLKRPG
jgi:hypothetical protein